MKNLQPYFPALFAVLFAVCCYPAQAQQFDWQYSARLPFNSPAFFVGGGISALATSHSAADFRAINPELGCGNYRSGSGFGWAVCANAEQWLDEDVAVGARVEYAANSGVFTTAAEPVPVKVRGESFQLHREFSLTASLSVVSLDCYGKWLIPETHFHIGAGLGFGVLSGSGFSQTESITAPEQFMAEIPYGEVDADGVSAVMLRPSLRIGYDAELARGLYATPVFSIGFPLTSAAAAAGWRFVSYSFGVQFQYGLVAVKF